MKGFWQFMKSTIQEIADKAGVSTATVSRVLNDSPLVKEDTKARVLGAIKSLNYVPSAFARGLSRSASKIIGVVVPEISNPFFSELITSIYDALDETDYNIILCNTNENSKKELENLKMLQEYLPRGLIITPVADNINYDSKYIDLFRSMSIPVVLVDRDIVHGNFDGVFVDDTTSLFNLTSSLLKNGHGEDVVMLTGNMNLQLARNRLNGFKTAYQAHNAKFREENILRCDFSIDSGYKTTKAVLDSGYLPSAFVCANNTISIGFLKAVTEYNLKIPDDIAFVAFDTLDMIEVLHLNLTLARKDNVQMGKKAIEILLSKIDNPSDVTNKVFFTPKVVERGSEVYPKNRKELVQTRFTSKKLNLKKDI